MDKYDNQNGIHDDIKKAIETILEHNPTLYPKKIQVKLTNEKSKYDIQNLKIPELSQVKTFVHRIELKNALQNSNV